MSASTPTALRRFFLAQPPDQGLASLIAEDREHALKVLRVTTGEEMLGIDGQGGAWRLEVTEASRRQLSLRVLEELPSEPAPGESGAPLPWIEIWLPFPKSGRAEEMVDRLTQLGVARVAGLATERTAPHAREAGEKRVERLLRRAREACKQSGRRWMPEIEPVASLEERLEGLPDHAQLACLDPRATSRFGDFLNDFGPIASETRQSALILALGPEGGWSPAEEDRLVAAGATRVRLTPHVLRIETAAEAACAIAAHALQATPGVL